MRPAIILAILGGMFWGYAAQAGDIDIPALGIKFTNYPAAFPKPMTVERPDGYSAWMHVGQTDIKLYRDDALAPKNHTVTDPEYQKLLEAEFQRNGFPISEAGLSKIGGHDAWLIAGAKRLPFGGIYRCEAFVVVDQHLVHVTVTGFGVPRRPAEFDRAVKMFDDISFEPVVRPAVPEPTSAATAPGKMPRFVDGSAIIYPDHAIARRHQGIVDVSFNIDANGNVQHIEPVYAQHRDLVAPLPAFLGEGRFRVPSDWAQTDSQERRFTIEFQFAIVNRGNSCPQENPPRATGALVITICHTMG